MKNSIEWVGIEKLKPHPKNPNKHSIAQIERLAKLIKYQGWRRPIIVSELSGYMVTGHGGLEAAKLLEQKCVPVHYQPFKDAEQEYAFMVSDNAIANWANLDLELINTEIPSLGDFDLELLGISDFSLDSSTTELPNLNSEDKSPYQQMAFILHDSQVEEVKRALAVAKAMGPFDSLNENENGNAIARICEIFLTQHGNC